MHVHEKMPDDGLAVGVTGQTKLWTERWFRLTGRYPVVLDKRSAIDKNYGTAKRYFIHSVLTHADK